MILAINPGSTSTKIALYDGLTEVSNICINHDVKKLDNFDKIINQLDYRLNLILNWLASEEIEATDLDAVVGRGGLLKPISGGTYKVNEAMISDLEKAVYGEHASNLGALLAKSIAESAHCSAYIVDPVVVDELSPVARISGIPEIKRHSRFHALNQRAVARKYASHVDKEYEKLNLIVAHFGGGITIGIHKKGEVVDVNDGLSGSGPFTPNRSGGLPSFELIKMCFSGKYSYKDIKNKLISNGGVIAYLGSNNMTEIENKIKNGDQRAELIYKAMIYQVAKEIGALSTVVGGKIDAILLTGGIAYSDYFTNEIKEKVNFIAPVKIYPGEEELLALAAGVYRVLMKKEEVCHYN